MKLNNMKSLIKVLKKVVSHLEGSLESDWSPLTPNQVAENLKKQIRNIEQNNAVDKDSLVLEFAPTSTIQEIAISNGWSNEYLKLSEQFDNLISNV